MKKIRVDKNVRPGETRTSATVYIKDLALMQSISKIKFNEDNMNKAWKESVKLFIKKNIHLLEEQINTFKNE